MIQRSPVPALKEPDRGRKMSKDKGRTQELFTARVKSRIEKYGDRQIKRVRGKKRGTIISKPPGITGFPVCSCVGKADN